MTRLIRHQLTIAIQVLDSMTYESISNCKIYLDGELLKVLNKIGGYYVITQELPLEAVLEIKNSQYNSKKYTITEAVRGSSQILLLEPSVENTRYSMYKHLQIEIKKIKTDIYMVRKDYGYYVVGDATEKDSSIKVVRTKGFIPGLYIMERLDGNQVIQIESVSTEGNEFLAKLKNPLEKSISNLSKLHQLIRLEAIETGKFEAISSTEQIELLDDKFEKIKKFEIKDKKEECLWE